MSGEISVARVFTANARRLGMVSAVGTVLLSALYAATLIAGLMERVAPHSLH